MIHHIRKTQKNIFKKGHKNITKQSMKYKKKQSLDSVKLILQSYSSESKGVAGIAKNKSKTINSENLYFSDIFEGHRKGTWHKTS